MFLNHVTNGSNMGATTDHKRLKRCCIHICVNSKNPLHSEMWKGIKMLHSYLCEYQCTNVALILKTCLYKLKPDGSLAGKVLQDQVRWKSILDNLKLISGPLIPIFESWNYFPIWNLTLRLLLSINPFFKLSDGRSRTVRTGWDENLSNRSL